MKIKSQIITQASGSIGGLTASRNAGGMYFRARAIPVNPNSPQQQAVRGIMADLSNLWGDTLTALQRQVWFIYAQSVPVIDRLGDPIILSAQQMYIRSNVPRIQAGLARIDDAPTTFNLGSFTNPSFAGDAANDEVDVTFDNTDAWANEDDAAMLVYASPPKSATINYYKGPYRFAGVIAGDATTPPTSPAVIAAPFGFAAGQRVFCQVRVSRADGRLSYPFRDFALGA